jgi:hypothetical protein
MDQVKEFLKQCVKYRFWIAVGIAFLLPMIGYFVGSASINEATTKEEAAIKAADTDIKKYTASNLPNAQYQPIVAEKKEVLAKDVDATWRKLYAIQAPLLRWPEQVEPEFRKWGRKWPQDVDRGQVQKAIIDYTIDYPNFVSNVYKTLKPWNPEDGKGIVAAPEEKMLIMPAPFTVEAPPELGAVWAEQERLWVMTALLDVVAKANDSVGAKDWDGAIIKQINAIEVGTPTAQDQKSLAKGVVLEPAPILNPDGTSASPATAAAAAPAAAALGLGTGFVDGQRSAVHLFAVERRDGRLRFRVRPHLHEAEPFGTARVAVHDHLRRLHGAVRFEHRLQVTVGHAVGQVPHVQLLAHEGPPEKTARPRRVQLLGGAPLRKTPNLARG